MKFSACLAALLVAAPALADDAAEEESGASLIASVDLGVYDNYYFRGSHIWEGAIAFQPSLTLGASTDFGDFTFNLWASVPFLDRDELEAVRDEIDFTIAWEKTFADRYTVGVGMYSFVVFQEDFHTEEVWATLGVDVAYGLSVSAGLYGDITELKGVYYAASVDWSGTFVDELISVEASLFHGGGKYKDVPFAITEGVGLSVDVGFALGAGFSVTPQGLVNYNADLGELTWYAGGALSWEYE